MLAAGASQLVSIDCDNDFLKKAPNVSPTLNQSDASNSQTTPAILYIFVCQRGAINLALI
jgi:hypothetical protein